MTLAKVSIQVASGSMDENMLMMGDSLIKRLKIPTHQYVVIRFGAFKQQVQIIPAPRLGGIRVSQSTARRMGLVAETQLRLKYKPGSATLSLGPLIGVLVTRDYPSQTDRPFGSITAFCRELVTACQQAGAHVYFFTPQDLKGSISAIQGWIYAGGWRRAVLPAPDIVNNRLTTRKLEDNPSVQHFMREVKSRYQTSIFNEKFLNKTEVFKALSQTPDLLRYLPESHPMRNFQTLKTMCTRYPVVFLKPIRGSLGKGIIRISRQDDKTYACHFATVNGTRKQSYDSLPQLFTALSGKFKSTRYQLQQGLKLLEISQRPVDFRALVQKNIQGKWTITSIVARIAGNHRFVSNLARGGTLCTVREALSKSDLSASKVDLQAKLKTAALDIAKGIDSQIPAHFGELGIDLAIDANGRIWLLEVNSKPSKNDNTPLIESKIRPSVRQVVQYARFLSGF